MSSKSLCTIIVYMILCLTSSSFTQTPDTADTQKVWNKATISGTLMEIDMEQHSVVILGSDGLEYALSTDTLIDLSQFMNGDTVSADYYQSYLMDAGTVTPEERDNPDLYIDDAITPPEGTNPGTNGLAQIKTIATIQSIDPKKQIVVVKNIHNARFILYVPDRELQQMLTQGSEFSIVYAKGIAISLSKHKQIS